MHSQISIEKLAFTRNPILENTLDPSINDIVQDNEGYIWYATENGLYRFDGVHVQIFKTKADDVRSLPHNRVFDLQIDLSGKLWVATSGGLAFYDELHMDFVRVFSQKKSLKKDVYVQTVQVDSDNKIWFSTSHFLWCYNQNNEQFDSVKVPKLKDKVGEPFIHSFHVVTNHKIYLSVDRGLYFYNIDNKKFVLLSAFNPIEKDLVLHFSEEKGKCIWATSRGGKLLKINIKDDKIDFLENKIRKFSSVYVSQDAQVYFTLLTGGLATFDDRTNSIIPQVNEYFNFPDHQSISCLLIDNQKNIWLGHPKNGVSVAYSSRKFLNINNSKLEYKELRSNVCTAVISDKDDNLWIGSFLGGLHKKPKNENCFLIHDNYTQNVQSIYQALDSKIWVGTIEKGVFILDKSGIIERKIEGVKDVKKIIEDKNGIFWFVSHGYGIYSYDPKSMQLKHFFSLENSALAPKGDWTFDIICDSKNRLWIASNLGLSLINTKRSEISHFTHDKNNSSTIVSNDLRALIEDSKGRIWIGTLEGVSILDPIKLKFKNVMALKGIFFNSFGEDKLGNIWTGSDNGLYQFNFDGKVVKYFTVKDGLISNSFQERSFAKSKNGDMIFGTNRGMIVFNPQKLFVNKYPSGVAFRSIKNNEKEVLSYSFSQNHIKSGDYWQFSHSENNFTFQTSVLNFNDAQNNSILYRLIGHDTAWQFSEELKITYTNLIPDRYILEVKAVNHDGVQSIKKAVFLFEIIQPWWKSWWAYSIYLIILITAIWVIYTMVRMRLKTSRQVLIERIKNEQLEELYEAKINFFTNISHDIRTPLSLIYGPLESLLSNQKLDAEHRKILSLIQRNAKQLLKLVNELLEFKKIESNPKSVNLDLVNITFLLSQLVEDFRLAAFQKNIEFDFRYEEKEIFVLANPSLLERSFQNLLANAFKFTPDNGRISLNIKISNESPEEFVCIEIQDSGKGIEKSDHNKIFQQFYQGKNSKGSGLGLFIVKKCVEQMNGEISVQNNLGALFKIKLPIQKKTLNAIDNVVELKKIVEVKPMKSKVVLVVEDNDELRDYIETVLVKYFTVLTAENGEKGFSLALSATPDLILTDVMMPVMDGINLCSKIKNSIQTSHIPIFMLTAKTNINDEILALDNGADVYLSKPFEPSALVLKIRNAFETRVNQDQKNKSQESDLSNLSSQNLDVGFLDDYNKLLKKEFCNPDFSIELMCQELGLSRSQLYKKVISLTGVSPLDFLQDLRLREAMHLIKKTNLTFTEIAFKVGYNDSRYFSNRFKKFTGFTPGEYREKD